MFLRFIHAIVWISFLSEAEQCLIVCIFHIVFLPLFFFNHFGIHSSVHEHLGVYLRATMNNVAMNIGVYVQVPAFNSLGICTQK